MNQIARTDDRTVAIENHINQQVSSAISVGTGGISFQNAGEVMEYAKMMAVSGSAVPKHLRGQPGACLGIIDDAIRFRTSPYALARKSYFVNDNLAYEAQVIAGVINAFAPLKQRPDIKWEGEGPDRVCIVIAEFKDGSVREVRSPKLKDIHPKNSPLWKSDPDQQQSYYTLRSFARRWCPEIILGIYDVEEVRSIDHRDDERRQSLADRLSAAREGSAQEPIGPREGFNPDFVTRETEGLSSASEIETNKNSSAPSSADEEGSGQVAPSPSAPDHSASDGDEVGEPEGEATDGPDASGSPADSVKSELQRECIDNMIRAATDADKAKREELVSKAYTAWLKELPNDEPFVKRVFETCCRLVEDQSQTETARKYLMAKVM